MKKTTAVLVLACAATTIGISIAPLAGADTTNCETVGGTTLCGQGEVRGEGAAPEASVPGRATGGCSNAYGGYQNCNVH
ncbi:hypothetical protein [Mycobacterium sp.]|uniref:hypothetical protein n=1 Tax=Mycobacterium sp. TaxID=1785 RepID=UPI002BCE065B|nr:hypothetical protein [Mycobacterium sp.]HME50570.1 hypothetical protein [Mycobacterium sp.]